LIDDILLNYKSLAIFVSLIVCKENRIRIEVTEVLEEWTDKKIEFPKNIQCCIAGDDTLSSVCNKLLEKDFKILLYVDSTGCSDCRLKLFEWQKIISESDSLFCDKVGFLFFFQPKSKKELSLIFEINDFSYPVFIDKNNTIYKLNKFSAKEQYQCFLLDKNNVVLAIGNPVLNPKIWKLYKDIIIEESYNPVIQIATLKSFEK
jgi:hypothetical protein